VDEGRLEPDERVNLWENRVNEDPDDVISRTLLADSIVAAAQESGDHPRIERAEDEVEVVLAAQPEYFTARVLEATIKLARHDASTGLSLTEDLLEDAPDEPAVHLTMGDAHVELGDYQAAEAAFAAAGDLEDSAPMLARRARLGLLTGDDSAIDLALQAAEAARGGTRTEHAWYHVLTANVAARLGEADIATEAASNALELSPEWPYAQAAAGKADLATGDLDGAQEWYEAAVATLPEPDWLGALADIAQVQGRDTDAAELRATAVEGADPLLDRRALVHLLVDQGDDLERALSLAVADADIRGGTETHNALARAALASGELELAVEHADRALAFGSKEPAVLFTAGEVAMADGRSGEGRELLAQALEIDPRFDVIDADVAKSVLGREVE